MSAMWGFALTGRGWDTACQSPPGQLPEALRAALTQHEARVLAAMARHPRPYLTSRGELIVPRDANVKYHWWAEGQGLRQTLEELGASPDILARYVDWI